MKPWLSINEPIALQMRCDHGRYIEINFDREVYKYKWIRYIFRIG